MTAKPAAVGSVGKKRKLVNVHLLNGDQHVVYVDVKSKFQEVFNQVAVHLSLRETEYFGLAFKRDNEYNFILLDEKIHKLAPKQWKSGSGEGLDGDGKALINVWFRVQFYVDQVILLREKVTRHQYYLQLKDNVLQYNHLYNEEKCFQLAGYALQADFGNYIQEKHGTGYLDPALYFPKWMLDRHGADYLARHLPTVHRDLHNMTKNDAELRYIRNASLHPGAHNLHFYTVKKRKSDKALNTWLAVCAKGVEVYEDDAGYKNHISTFLWRDIGKLYFDKKKFEIRSVQSAGGRRYMYYTDCDIKSKYLLSICRGTHMFQMAIQPKLMEIQHLDNEDQKRYRESYIYSDSRDRSHFQHSPSKSLSAAGSNQRFSLISDASSTTTSGIVSDRMAISFDDGDDHTKEIMIDCPPRSAMASTPSQMKSKFQLLSSFKQSPQSNKTSPSLHGLDIGTSENISPQELSPTSSNGSWRARHSQTAAYFMGHGGLSLPSPTTPTHDNSPYTGIRRNGQRDSSSKLLPGSLLSSVDRNTSGDSAVSVSGILIGSDKLAPLSLPPSEHRTLPTSSHIGKPGKAGISSNITNFSLATRSALNHAKAINPSSPVSVIFTPLGATNDAPVLGLQNTPVGKENIELLKAGSSPREVPQAFKFPPTSEYEHNEKMMLLNSPRANFSELYGNSYTMPNKVPEQSSKYNQDALKTSVGSRDQYAVPVPQRRPQSTIPDLYSSIATTMQVNQTLLSADKTKDFKSVVDPQPVKENKPQLTLQNEPVNKSVTEHYRLALQQGSVHFIDQQASVRSHFQEGFSTKETSLRPEVYQKLLFSGNQQQSQQQQILQHQSIQSNLQECYPHGAGNKEFQKTSSLKQTINKLDLQENEENKENYFRDDDKSTKCEDTVSSSCQQSSNKAMLHPELKQILGQSHAISLPLITALCNDSTLMQASRSQSGSRSSYDTSTVRSTDSRLTRLSHETDPRRWSSCGQADVMLSVQSSRPYSWHSEHLDLDTQLALPITDHLTPTSVPNPRAVNNKHLKIADNQNNLPPKMIESDPGPSSPRIHSHYCGTFWWDTPSMDMNSSSWTEVIPYSFSAHSLASSSAQHTGQPHQHMVPHKLSSGGHRNSDSSITHKQMMKENIGIA
uniref:FERM domain-containing protein n=1 Tax=Biomphalaria glabrata TaxID=6526 RepID=A0A2C9KW49_BIOGL